MLTLPISWSTQQGTRLILNLCDTAAKGEMEPTFDLSLEFSVHHHAEPVLKPCLVAGMTGAVPGTVTSATIISIPNAHPLSESPSYVAYDLAVFLTILGIVVDGNITTT